MWGGVPKSSLSKPDYSELFRFHKTGRLYDLRHSIISSQSPTTTPRPWALFHSLDAHSHRLRNQDCALLLKWTKDMYLHYTHREEKMQAMQLGAEMFDTMLRKHIVGLATLQQFLALCECSGDLQTAMSRFNYILEKCASSAASGLGEKSSSSSSSPFDPEQNSNFNSSLGTNPANYVWLMRIAQSSSNGGAGSFDFDSIPFEEAMRSIAEIVIPRDQMMKIDFNNNNSSTSSDTSQKRSRMRRFSSSSLSKQNNNSHVDDSLIALVAPHDTTEIQTSAVAISRDNNDNNNNRLLTSPSSSLHHQHIPFSIAVMFHLLRPQFRTDEKLQKIVDLLITPSLLAQDEHESRTLTSIPVSPNHLHLRYLKNALMNDLVLSKTNYYYHHHHQGRQQNSGTNKLDLQKHIQVSKFLLRKTALSLRNFNHSSAELSDGPRGSAGMLWIGGADNWDNAQPGFDYSEILSEEFSPSPSSSLLSTSYQSNNRNNGEKDGSRGHSSSSLVSVEKHYAVSSFAAAATNSRVPYSFQWTFSNPYPLANSILSEGHVQDIVETLASLTNRGINPSSSSSTESKLSSLLVHKLALLVAKMPKQLLRRFEMDSLLPFGVPYFRADSFELLKGGAHTEYQQLQREALQEKASTHLIFQTLTSSSSTPELLHYLLCAVGRIAPGKAIEALCKMLQHDDHQQHQQNNSLLLLPLDPTLATLICCLLVGSSKGQENQVGSNQVNKETLRLAASLMAHSSLLRRRRLDSYRDAKINDDLSPVLRSVWFKRHFDHVFETNCMSEVQFLTFVGREVGPEILVELFRVSTQMVEDIVEEMAAEQASVAVKKMEARKEIEFEKKQIEEATAITGGAVSSAQLLEKLQKLHAAQESLDDIFLFDEAQFFTEKSPVVRAFEEMKQGKKNENSNTNDNNNIEETNLNEGNDDTIKIMHASTDTLVLNYPALRQALQLCLLRTCSSTSSSPIGEKDNTNSLVVDFDLIQQKNQALLFAPTHSPLFDLACIGNMTGFSRYQQPTNKSGGSWSNLSHVVETLKKEWMSSGKNKIVLLDSSFIEFSEKFLSLKAEDPSIVAVLVPHCVVSSIDATATCPELAPVDVESLSLEQEVKRTANLRMSQLATAAMSGVIEVVQFTEQLLAAALTTGGENSKRQNDSKKSFLIDEKLEELILQKKATNNNEEEEGEEDEIADENVANRKSQLAHLKMIESQMKDMSESPFRLINDVNTILIDVAKMLSLAAAQIVSSEQNSNSATTAISPKIVIATNDICLIDRIHDLNNNDSCSYGIGIMTSVPIEVLRNPDSIENLEQKDETNSILGVLHESLADDEEEIPKFVDVSKIDQELVQRRDEVANTTAFEDPYAGRSQDDVSMNSEKREVGLWQQIVDENDDDEIAAIANGSDASIVSAAAPSPSFTKSGVTATTSDPIRDHWRAKNSREERFPPFQRPGVSFSQEFRGRLRASELPLRGALAGELDKSDPDQKSKNSNCPVGLLNGIREIKKRKNQLTPFRAGFVFEDEAYRNRPATYRENETSAVMMSRPLMATVPPDMRYRKFQANVNDPRNADLVKTYHHELKETKEKRKNRN